MPGARHRDADAGADLDQMIVDLVALAQIIDDAPGQVGGVLRAADVLLEHHELVAAEARHEILRPQHVAQAIGDRAQELVAAGMAERIVDLLELVEVDEQQRRELVGLARRREEMLDLVAEIDAVGQCGQFVITRKMADPRFGGAPLGDVLDQHHRAAAGHRLERPGQRAAAGDVRIGRDDVAGLRILDLGQDDLAADSRNRAGRHAGVDDFGSVRLAVDHVVRQLHHLAEAVVHDRETAVGAEHAESVRHVVQGGIELARERRFAFPRHDRLAGIFGADWPRAG